MKKEDISQIVSDINEKYIEEAAQPVKRKAPVMKYALAAACVCIAVLAAVLIGNSGLFDPKIPEKAGEDASTELSSDALLRNPEIGGQESMTEAVAEGNAEGAGEMAIVPQWADLAVSMKYTEIKSEDLTYHTMATDIPSESVGEFLFNTEMQGYDIYTDTTYTVNAQIYSLKNILKDCAVVAKFEEDDKYYVYTNAYYAPETLGDMINDLNLRETLSFGKAYSDYTDDIKHTMRTYEDFDDSIVWDMLLSDENIKNVSYDRFYDKIVGISVDIPVLGFKNISLGVTKDGYLITNIMSTQKCFFIGKEKAEAFGEYIENNVKYTEATVVYKNPDGSIPGKEDIGQSTPGYNPDDPMSTPPSPPDHYVPGYETTPPYTPDHIAEATTKTYQG